MKRLFSNVRKFSTSSSSSNSNFNLRRLSLNSSTSMPTIKVLRGGYNIDLQKVDSTFTKLHKAVYLNNVDRVKKYLAQKIGVNSRDNYGRTALHLAAVNGNLRIIGMLLMASANVNVQDADGKSPLMKAIECGHAEVLPMLMEAGADIDLADHEHGNTALHHSLINANLECSLYIIRNALIMDYNKRNQKQETFLHLCAKIPDLVSVIEELIANGIQIEAIDEHGRTAAQVASFHSNTEAFRIITMYATAQQQPVVMDDDASNDLDFTDDTVDSSHTENHRKQQRNSISSASALGPGCENAGTGVSTRAPSRSNSKLSSDSFASSTGSNYYRFSGLFEQTIVEENQNSISTSSAATASTSKSNSQQQDNLSIKTSGQQQQQQDNDIQSENIYANFDLPPNQSNNENSEHLSDEMSELDQMLNVDIGADFQLHSVKPNADQLIFNNNMSNSSHNHNNNSHDDSKGWLGLIDDSDEMNDDDESILVVAVTADTAPSGSNNSNNNNIVTATAGGRRRNSSPMKLQLLKEKVVDIEQIDKVKSLVTSGDSEVDVEDHDSSIYSNIIEIQESQSQSQVAAAAAAAATTPPSRSNHQRQSLRHSNHNNVSNNRQTIIKSNSSPASSQSQSSPAQHKSQDSQETTSPKSGSSLVRQKSYAQVLASTPRKIANVNANQNNNTSSIIIQSSPIRTSNNNQIGLNRTPSERRQLLNRGSSNNNSFRSKNSKSAFFQSISTPGSVSGSPIRSGHNQNNNNNNHNNHHFNNNNRFVANNRNQGQGQSSPQHPQQFVSKVKSNRQSISNYLADDKPKSQHFVRPGSVYHDSTPSSSSLPQSPANNNSLNNNRIVSKSQSIQSTPLPLPPTQQQSTTVQSSSCIAQSNHHSIQSISITARPLPPHPQTIDSKSCQTDSSPLFYSSMDSSQKYSNFMETLGRLLFSSTSLSNDQNSSSAPPVAGENAELAYLKRLTAVIRESNQTKIELELKQKEVALLEQITEQMRQQIDSEQRQREELERKFGQWKLMAEELVQQQQNNCADSSMIQFGQMSSSLKVNKPQSAESADLGLSVLVDFMKEHYTLKMKHYETVLNEQLMENFSLKKRCHFLTEQLRSWQQEPRSPSTNIDMIVTSPSGEMLNSSGHEMANAGLVMNDLRINSFSNQITTTTTSPTRSVPNNNNSNNNDDEIQKRESMIQQFYDEISGLKQLMSQLVTGLGGESGCNPVHKLERYQNGRSSLNSSLRTRDKTLSKPVVNEELISSSSSSTHTVDGRTPSPPPVDGLLVTSSVDNTPPSPPAVPKKPKKLCTLSRKKSFSMYDLTDVDFRYDFGPRNNNENGDYLSPNNHHHNNNNFVALLLDDLDKQSIDVGGGAGVGRLSMTDDLLPNNNNNNNNNQRPYYPKLNSNNNLHQDYSGTFSYKSKYFQRKINELKHKLAINT